MADDLPFEAVKVSMSQTKDGVRIVLLLHPHDDPAAMAELFNHPVGARYMAALVRLSDQDQPVERPRDKTVAAAAMLCRSEDFQNWMQDAGLALSATEDDAAEGLCRACGIKSRSELAISAMARQAFDTLRLRFSKTMPRREGL